MVGDEITAVESYEDEAGYNWTGIPNYALFHGHNLEVQEELTNWLFRMKPVLSKIRVLDIASILGVKLGITSKSQTASGKESFI
jgi:hypothetical protein